MTSLCTPVPRWTPAELFLWSVLVLVLWPPAVSAHSTGMTTLSLSDPATTGCNACHSLGRLPRVTLEGPGQVLSGTTSTYVFRVFTTGSQRSAGFNVSAPFGELAIGGPDSALTLALPGTDNRTEITHSARKAAEGDSVSFSFRWTAPAEASTVTLRLWGNAVNGDGASTGDRAATLLVPIVVVDADPPTPTPTATEAPAPTATPTPPQTPPCPGNCNGDNEVTVDEILTGVSVAQGLQSLEVCPPFDTNGDSQVTIDDILAVVSAALNGCPM